MDTPLAKITDTLARHPELMLGIVFGSTADKTSTAHSDLDVAVAGAHALSAEEKLRLIDELALDSNRAIDLVDPDVQDIVAINLQRAIQLCVAIGAHLIAESEAPAPVTMGETFEGLVAAKVIPAALGERLRKAVGLRNIAAAIDWAIVQAVCTTRLPDFSEFAQAISGRLSR